MSADDKDEADANGRQEAMDRKHQVLSRNTPSDVESIASAIVIKDEDLFFLSDAAGRVPLGGDHGLGLYYHDCRYLNGYELYFGGAYPDVLASTGQAGYSALFQLANGTIPVGRSKALQKERISMRWERVANGANLSLDEVLTFRNHGVDAVVLPVTFRFDTAFEDIFIVRGLLAHDMGTLTGPTWNDGILTYLYHGSDGLYRSLAVHFSPRPDRTTRGGAQFQLPLESQESRQIRLSLEVAEGQSADAVEPQAGRHPSEPERRSGSLQTSQDRWLQNRSGIESTDHLLDRVIGRSLLDLRILRTSLRQDQFFAAGAPWFVTLFGRDSAITAIQTLAFDRSISEQTLRLLASFQGTEVNDWDDQEPGKILHELRIGELARRGTVPYSPYYGSVDSTPLFLLLLAKHVQWTGDLNFFHELRDNVDRALGWIDHFNTGDLPGYVSYRSASDGGGLVNQGWKDSGDAIVNDDGSLAQPPIALVEVQAYVYQAKQELASLFERAGEQDRASALRQQADELRERFNRDFWLEDRGFYALALQKGHRPAAVLTSNPGHALWCGIAEPERARQVMERLTHPDMFTGWGVRTLSTSEHRFNPVGYHLGTVWPHDNSILAAGFRRYGHDDAAMAIYEGIRDAAIHFHLHRLPEVFAGFSRDEYASPVHYPVACHPQAWAAGSIPFLLQTMLGLHPEGFENRLRVVHPMLPMRHGKLVMRGIRIGTGTVDLRFHVEDGRTEVEVMARDGAEVVVE